MLVLSANGMGSELLGFMKKLGSQPSARVPTHHSGGRVCTLQRGKLRPKELGIFLLSCKAESNLHCGSLSLGRIFSGLVFVFCPPNFPVNTQPKTTLDTLSRGMHSRAPHPPTHPSTVHALLSSLWPVGACPSLTLTPQLLLEHPLLTHALGYTALWDLLWAGEGVLPGHSVAPACLCPAPSTLLPLAARPVVLPAGLRVP